MLKSPQNKGKRGEYIVRDLIRGFGFEVQRTPMSGAISFMKGDLISARFPWFIEVKNTVKTQFAKWYKKAADQAESKPPMIAWLNKGDVYAFLLLSDLLQLMSEEGIIKQVFSKKKPSERLSLEETSELPFSKFKQLMKNDKTKIT